MREYKYTFKEVRVMVEGYRDLQPAKTVYHYGLRILVQLLDIERGIKILSLEQKKAVFVRGIFGKTPDEASKILGMSPGSVERRYLKGLVGIMNFLNGE